MGAVDRAKRIMAEGRRREDRERAEQRAREAEQMKPESFPINRSGGPKGPTRIVPGFGPKGST